MQSFIRNTVTAGRYATADELVSELTELGAAVAGIDQDNVAAITAAKVAIDAWGEIIHDDRFAAQVTTLTDAVAANDVFPIPDDANVPWIYDFTCGDGELSGTFGQTWAIGGGLLSVLWIGVELDGVIIAVSPSSSYGRVILFEDSAEVDFAVPIGAGPHRLALVFGFSAASLAAGTAYAITWNGGAIFAEATAR